MKVLNPRLVLLVTIILGLIINCGSDLSAQPNCMQIGVGLEGPAYWANGENAFIDQMKYRGGWISFNASGSSPWDTQLHKEIPLDQNGYPDAGIPYLTSGGKQKVRIVVSSTRRVEPGPYVFLYDGYGSFSFYGMTVVNSVPGRIDVNLTGTGNVWMHLDSSSLAPNHARNFRLVPLGQENTYEQDLFRANFLDKLAPFSTLRFMDWFHTNDSPIISWDMRSTPESFRQSDSAGIAYEYAITLCNRTGKDAWVNVPHMADSTYISEMAKLWHDSLSSNLDVYLEYSNEVWNWQFKQAQWNIQNTTYLPAWWPLNSMYDSGHNFAWNIGRHAAQVFRIWRREWGADSLRVQRVLGTQAVWPEAVSVGNVEGCGRKYDYLSPTWYFGLSTNQSAAFGASTTPQAVIDTCRNNFFGPNLAKHKAHYTIVDTTGGKGVVYYEGGQHISAYGNNSHPALQAFFDAQIHPDMYTLYNDVLDTIRNWGAELAMAFTLGGRNSQYGSWGHIISVDSTPTMTNAPKYIALIDNLPHPPIVDLGADSSLCDGEQLILDASANVGAYSWNDGSTNASLTVTQTGLYSVTVTDSINCKGTDEIQVLVNPLPQPSILATQNGLQVDFQDLSGAGATWLWSFGDGVQSNLQQPSHSYSQSGTYLVCLDIMDANGCWGSDCDSINVISVTNAAPLDGNISIWPNPVKDDLYIQLGKNWDGAVEVNLLDLAGKNILQNRISVGNQRLLILDLASLPAGLYLIEIRNAESDILAYRKIFK